MWRPYLLRVRDVVPAAPGLLPGIAFIAAVRAALDDLHAHVLATALQGAAQGILGPHRRLEGSGVGTGKPDEQLAVLRPGQAQFCTGKRALPQRDADFRGPLARFGDQDAIHQLAHEGIYLPGSRGCLYGGGLHVPHAAAEKAVQQRLGRRCLLPGTAPAILRLMRIHDPADVLRKYPHQLSGGMLQRVMIGLAICMQPSLIIADEPTTAIDSISQYAIMQEFLRIKRRGEVSMIFISHDLGVLSLIADKVIVMHDGKAVESGTAQEIFDNATDTYTRHLIKQHRAVMHRFLDALHAPVPGRIPA